MTTGPDLTLRSDSLLSKWGFQDGDMPDAIWDHLDDNGVHNIDWHAVLRTLVRRHLLPALHQEVEVYDIETTHNPIRAGRVDGVEIDDTADHSATTLTPDHVTVSWEHVEAAIREAGQTP